MQSVKMTINHLTGNGWHETETAFKCDENIGLNAGRDIYATARGTAIKLTREVGLLCCGVKMYLVIDNDVHIQMFADANGKVNKSSAAKIGYPVKWPLDMVTA